MLDNSFCPIKLRGICGKSITKSEIKLEIKSTEDNKQSSIRMPKNDKRNLEARTNMDSDMANNNHSNTNINKNDNLVNINSYSISRNDKSESCDVARCLHIIPDNEFHELYKNETEYGRESIIRKRVNVVCGGRRGATNLKFKYERDAQKWTEAFGSFGKTMVERVRFVALVSLLVMMLGTCAAAPHDSRPTRSLHLEKSAKTYLERFGYLRKNQPEVGNLQKLGANEVYEDDLKIAIKMLQQFAGIPITGEIDDETLKLMKRRRCGRPDIEPAHSELTRKKRFVIQGEKWRHTNLTWSLSSKAHPSQLDLHGTRAGLARALDVWAQESRLTFQEINSDDADIVVSFVRGYHDDAYPFDGRGNILAHAFFPGTGRGGDAHFDDDELWLLQPKNDEEEGTSLLAVAAHEFGHSLGLSHSSVVGALMYPYYQGIQPNFVLPEDDRNGIQQLYGPKERRTWGRVPHYRTTLPPTTTTTTTTTTRRPYHYHTRHPDRHPDRRPNYNPYYPRGPVNYPTYTPYKPTEKPYYPDRRYYNTSEDRPRRPSYHPYPTETTTPSSTHHPRYPQERPEYPRYPRPNYPTDSRPTNPRENYPKKPHYPKITTEKTTIKPSDKPNTCDTSYDAVALIRGELFIFKGKYHWRKGSNGRYSDYPMEIIRMWPDLPHDLTHVDAVYERPDRNIAFFIGKKIYLFDSVRLKSGYPKSLASLGLPETLEKLDAAMIWGHNGKTYFYSGTNYWKYDEDIGRVEPDYPRDMIMWRGVGYDIDSVFQWKDGKTYFFKGKGFWKFNDLRMTVEHEKQLPSAPFWMNCRTDDTRRRSPNLSPPESTIRSPSSASSISVYRSLPYMSTILFIIFSILRCCQ